MPPRAAGIFRKYGCTVEWKDEYTTQELDDLLAEGSILMDRTILLAWDVLYYTVPSLTYTAGRGIDCYTAFSVYTTRRGHYSYADGAGGFYVYGSGRNPEVRNLPHHNQEPYTHAFPLPHKLRPENPVSFTHRTARVAVYYENITAYPLLYGNCSVVSYRLTCALPGQKDSAVDPMGRDPTFNTLLNKVRVDLSTWNTADGVLPSKERLESLTVATLRR